MASRSTSRERIIIYPLFSSVGIFGCQLLPDQFHIQEHEINGLEPATMSLKSVKFPSRGANGSAAHLWLWKQSDLLYCFQRRCLLPAWYNLHIDFPSMTFTTSALSILFTDSFGYWSPTKSSVEADLLTNTKPNILFASCANVTWTQAMEYNNTSE